MSRQIRRKLVTVRRISNISPIAGSRYNVVTVDGWNVVVGRNEGFYDGQSVLYFEVDSLLPCNHNFWEFCAFSNNKSGYVVTTMIVSKHISQGLIFHLDTFTEFSDLYTRMKNRHGMETTEMMIRNRSFEDILGVKKWENTKNGGTTHSLETPPIFFPQPGCERAQNLPTLFRDHGEDEYQITEKLDGIPMSVYAVKKDSKWYSILPSPNEDSQCQQIGSTRIGICNRTRDLVESSTSLFWNTAKKQGITEKISQVGHNIAVQGELCGFDIMSNTIGFEPGEHIFFVFGIFDIDNQEDLRPETVKDICDRLGWEHVPIISDRIKLSAFANDVHDLLLRAEGTGMKGRAREGLVFKSIDASFAFKAISNPWLLETGKD
ncbi:RNA ligase-domain-containing protein [Annulohypoxylon maeteangense]|uniref:RNA ligase-domain-containing protein n=1 Tax=Annulohypoxylon maeteangense TaxID=1927788 RepID=UPI002008DC22|nr:RNA ligase-domain-containing protein [Annulohypoxylon maeteangense]KAI0887718.1 RNA ligase-domain-containing protein [Annulohypoxylon maeteangense]